MNLQALQHTYRLCGRGRGVFGSPAKSIFLAIIEWGWVWCEELHRSKITSEGLYHPRSLHYTKAEFNNSFNIHSKCFEVLDKLTSSLNFFKTLAYFSVRFYEIERCFFLTDTPQKVDNSHRASCFPYSFSKSLIIHVLISQSACINWVRCMYFDTQSTYRSRHIRLVKKLSKTLIKKLEF